MTAIVQAGEALRIRFDRFDDPADYALFLRTKSLPEHRLVYDEIADAYTVETPTRFAKILGIDVPTSGGEFESLAAHLFDYQSFFTRIALQAKRYAIWFDTGLGKTIVFLEWARQVQRKTGGRVLIVELLGLIPGVLEMAATFYGDSLPIRVLETRDEMVDWCRNGAPGIAITNPEKFIPRDGEEVIPELVFLAGIALDESSLLKTGGGAIKWALIKSCRGIEYKLSLTATPAPNDPIEYASQAAFLEKIRDEGEVIWTYFVRDADGEWKVKDHALADFYRFLSGWSCYVRNPARYGFADNLKDLPPPVRVVHPVPATPEQQDYFSRIPDASGQCSLIERVKLGLVERTKMGQVASGFIYRAGDVERVPSLKPELVVKITRDEIAAGRQVMVWTQYDETAEILVELLAAAGLRFEVLTGSVPQDQRQPIIDRFKAGEFPALVTRTRLLAFGQNLQNCGAQIFADFSDSYEQIYQGERRSYRYGQTLDVHLHFPIVQELQGVVWQNVERKRLQLERDVERMEACYIEAMRDLLPQRSAA